MMKNDYEPIKTLRKEEGKLKMQLIILKDSNTPEYFISLHLMNINISHQDLTKMRKLKYLNIIQPQNYYEEGKEKILIFPDSGPLKLTNKQLAQNYYRILLQLALTYAEFEQRQVNWPLNELSQLYYAGGILYISLLDFDFTKPIHNQSPFQIFRDFTLKHFSQYIPNIQNLFQQNQFKPVIEFLLEKNGDLHKVNYMYPPYENVLLFLLSQQSPIQLHSIYEMGNSVVKGFNTPESLKITYTRLGDHIVYKSTRYQAEEHKQQIQQNIQREIELMEQAFDSQYAVTCFAYIRIFEYSFLLQKKFVRTLAQFLTDWCKQTDREEKQTIKDVLLIANRFALGINQIYKALKSLKSFNILHRDLKPENLFLDHEQIHLSYIYIADFDRSKQFQGQLGDVMTTQNVQNTPKYDPPETTQSFYYDVYQFGLIILTIMNKGKYIGNEITGSRYFSQEDHNKYYSKQAIKNALSHTKYSEQFIDIISQCLQREPKERPDIQQIYSIINPLYLDTKIQKVRQTQPASESPAQQNIQQSRIKSNPTDNAMYVPILPTPNQDEPSNFFYQNNVDSGYQQDPQQYQQYPQYWPNLQQIPYQQQQQPTFQYQTNQSQQNNQPQYIDYSQQNNQAQQYPNNQPPQQPIQGFFSSHTGRVILYSQQQPNQPVNYNQNQNNEQNQQQMYQNYNPQNNVNQFRQFNNNNTQLQINNPNHNFQDNGVLNLSHQDSPTQVSPTQYQPQTPTQIQLPSNPKIKIISMQSPGQEKNTPY
ncbi:unnamed protein product (macronuclear) [Paramecium tetraurelia]|uniref:Protein kinase domain-containing protein n=1 Tax=Paramecium tetraurelia TaxID=5888 RepID=A0CDK3_PARTE|nr:uncharacterized protein GSPATT00007081001 [Paramecium tetraurelia]CAK68870.1 unnamed protein product [Paramecium tetraurelia]|eukprot:XP_001436267.1 hypothetical protein (macronuclear) [Paramecium tetraurelia strain d4-2]